jgi:hypothetical protein
MVTAPAFSIAPVEYSGQNIWSYLEKGYSNPKSFSKKAIDDDVRVNISSVSFSKYLSNEPLQNML